MFKLAVYDELDRITTGSFDKVIIIYDKHSNKLKLDLKLISDAELDLRVSTNSDNKLETLKIVRNANANECDARQRELITLGRTLKENVERLQDVNAIDYQERTTLLSEVDCITLAISNHRRELTCAQSDTKWKSRKNIRSSLLF
jgi:hypothetical protein